MQPSTHDQTTTSDTEGRTATVEGADAREALARVQAEHGPDARIVSAEKVLRGGLGGFFQREVVQLTVDVDGRPEGTTSRAVRPEDVHDESVGQRFLRAVQEAMEADEADAPEDETLLQLLDRAVGPQEADGRLTRDVADGGTTMSGAHREAGGATPREGATPSGPHREPRGTTGGRSPDRPAPAPGTSTGAATPDATGAAAAHRDAPPAPPARVAARNGYAATLEALVARTDAAERPTGTSAGTPPGGDDGWRERLNGAAWVGGLGRVEEDEPVLRGAPTQERRPTSLGAAIAAAREAVETPVGHTSAAPGPDERSAAASGAGARAREAMRAAAAEAARQREAVLGATHDGADGATATGAPPPPTPATTAAPGPTSGPDVPAPCADPAPDPTALPTPAPGPAPSVVARSGPWSTSALLRLGVPRTLVDRVVAAGPADDAAWTSALAAALGALCRPLGTGASVLVGPDAADVAAALRAPVLRIGDELPSEGIAALEADGDERTRGWLAREGADVHLVAGGDGWREWLWARPVAVSWWRADALVDALTVAADLAVPLGLHRSGRGPAVATPMDVAIEVRERLGERR